MERRNQFNVCREGGGDGPLHVQAPGQGLQEHIQYKCVMNG